MMTDFEQIQNLLARYCFLVDRASADEIVALFWDDITMNFGGNINSGIDEAKCGLERWIEKMRDPVQDLRHLLYTPYIEINGEFATSEAYYDADGHSKNKGKLIQLRGVYRDTLAKRHGEWRFLEREVVIWRSLQDHG